MEWWNELHGCSLLEKSKVLLKFWNKKCCSHELKCSKIIEVVFTNSQSNFWGDKKKSSELSFRKVHFSRFLSSPLSTHSQIHEIEFFSPHTNIFYLLAKKEHNTIKKIRLRIFKSACASSPSHSLSFRLTTTRQTMTFWMRGIFPLSSAHRDASKGENTQF